MTTSTSDKEIQACLQPVEDGDHPPSFWSLRYAANGLPDIDAAQQVVQLTFIRAYEQLNEYQPERDFGVWLCVICKHFILTELERQRRESRNLEKFSHAF